MSLSNPDKGRKKWATNRRDADVQSPLIASTDAGVPYRRAWRWWVAPPLPPEPDLAGGIGGEDVLPPRLLLRRRWSPQVHWES